MRPFIFTAALALLAVPVNAFADAGAVPLQKDICVGGVVNKQRLVDFLVSHNSLRWSFADDAAPAAAGANLPVWQWILADDAKTTCNAIAKASKANPAASCSKADQAALDAAHTQLTLILAVDGVAYANPARVYEPRAYLTSTSELLCNSTGGKPIEAAGAEPPPSAKSIVPPQLRIRGSADGLFFAGGSTAFKGLPSASLNLSTDGVAHKNTDKLVFVGGYALGTDNYEFVPYIGFNRNLTDTRGKPRSISTDTADAGVAASVQVRTPFGPDFLTNWFTVRPDYLFDYSDHSAIGSANAVYTPVLNASIDRGFGVNDYMRVVQGDPGFLEFEPIVEFHWDNGWYTERGALNAASHADYSRLGAKYGLSLTSDYAPLPLTLTVTDLELWAIRGRLRRLNYSYGDLSFALDQKKTVSVDLTYTNGRDEATAKRAQTLGLALSAKY